MKQQFDWIVFGNEAAFVCTNHYVEMSEDDARAKGCLASWSEGIFRPVIKAKIVISFEKRYTGDGKKRIVSRVALVTLCCPDCGRFEGKEVQNLGLMR